MEPVFTLQWSEYLIAQRLQKLLLRKQGYTVFIPLSRQEQGIDLAIVKRTNGEPSRTTTIQVKASRTYLHDPPKRASTVRYRYNTWFNRFDVPDNADLIVLCGLYAPDLAKTGRVDSTWYQDCTLIFTQAEARELMENCKTVGGKPDRMFGFGFNDLSQVIMNRGDMTRSSKDYSKYLLERRVGKSADDESII